MSNKKINVKENVRKEAALAQPLTTNEKENVIMKESNKTTNNVKEIKEMKEANNKPMNYPTFPSRPAKFTLEDLIAFANSVHYTQDVTITGICDVVIERYELGVSVKHAAGTFVYSMRSNNPEKDDIQPADKCEGYIKLYLCITQDALIERTTAIVRESNFGKFATALMHWSFAESPATLKTLLDAVIKDETKICVERVCETDAKGNKYYYYNWSKFTHQPRYKTDYVLNSAVNLELFKHVFDTNIYYRMPEYGQTYVVELENFFVKTGKQKVKRVNGKEITYTPIERLGLKLVNENFIYIIDTEYEITMKQIIEHLLLATGFAKYKNFEDILTVVKGKHFLFTPLDETTATGNIYEIFAFGKEVK